MFAIGQLSRNKQQRKVVKKNTKKVVKVNQIETYNQCMERMQKEYESYINSLDERDMYDNNQEWGRFWI